VRAQALLLREADGLRMFKLISGTFGLELRHWYSGEPPSIPNADTRSHLNATWPIASFLFRQWLMMKGLAFLEVKKE
jgi:hypothetical protein